MYAKRSCISMVDEKELKGITAVNRKDRYSIFRLNEENQIKTEHGVFVPRFTENGIAEKQGSSLSLYPDGAIRSISLDHPASIETEVGRIPAEFLTFHENGRLKEVFPVDIKGIRPRASDGPLLSISLPTSASLDARIACISFYQSEAVKSISLWPGEKVDIMTPLGIMNVRNGISFFENGTIESVEPAVPTPVKTPIGTIHAFDDMSGEAHEGRNSLMFSDDGELASLRTSSDQIVVINGLQKIHMHPIQQQMESDLDMMVVPMSVSFRDSTVHIGKYGFSTEDCIFRIERYVPVPIACTGDSYAYSEYSPRRYGERT
jgi:hypothetical protein